MTDSKPGPVQVHAPQADLKTEVTQKATEAKQASAAPPGSQPPGPPDKPKELETKTVKLKDLGPVLPLGILGPDGTYTKDISVRPWRMKEERELGSIRDAHRDANVAQYVGMVLATMCTKLGHHDLSGDSKMEEKRVIVGQMFMGDVFYAYVWLRIQALGNTLNLNLTCPHCTTKFPFAADLESIEVITAENLEAAKWEYKLKTPFQIRGKEVATMLLGPARWNGLEMMSAEGGGLNTGAAKCGIIQASIHGIPDWKDKDGKPQAIALGASELDEMSKRDIEELTNFIDDKSLGPNMSIEDNCKRCGRQFRLPIDWGYDSFFGVSSS